MLLLLLLPLLQPIAAASLRLPASTELLQVAGGARYQVPGIGIQVPGFAHQVPEARYRLPLATARCASWDIICQTDWVLTIQGFWSRYGDRERRMNWLRMLAVYQDQQETARWQATLSPATRRHFGNNVSAEAIIRSMKEQMQLQRPDWRTINHVLSAMRSLNNFSQGVRRG